MAKKTKLSQVSTKPVPVKIVNDAPKVSRNYEAEDRKYRAQSDMDTLRRAEEIRGDKERMKAMKEVARQQMKELKKIC